MVNNYDNSIIRSVACDKEFNPNSSERVDIFEILNDIQDYNMMGIKPPTYFQYKYFCHFYINHFSLERFKFNKTVQTRLYLDIKICNTVKVAEKLIDNALKTNTPLLFKFALSDGRNDNFVLYTDYENIYSLLNLIEQTKKEIPLCIK